MKRAFLVVSLSGLLFFTGSGPTQAQEEPKPKKDTVNIDTDAKPKFYYAVEDEKSNKHAEKRGSTTVIAIICGVVVVAAGFGLFLLKKKK